MGLPSSVTSHHTAWVSPPGGAPHMVRYAAEDDRLVCFGDGVLRDVSDGSPVSVAIHEIAGGPLVASLGARLVTIAPDDVSAGSLGELLDHVPLGRSMEEVCEGLEHARTQRRIVALTVQGGSVT